MARVKPLERSELDSDYLAMLEGAEASGGNTILARVMALCPDLFKTYFRFYSPSHEEGKVETALKELARLKIARLNACPT